MADLSPAKPIAARPPAVCPQPFPGIQRPPRQAKWKWPLISRDSPCGTEPIRRFFGVDIRIPARAVTAIIGPSGCGKSTFLRGAEPHARIDAGHADRRQPPPVRGGPLRGIDRFRLSSAGASGMVFQKSNPFPTMSIADNVLVGLRLNGVRDRKLLRDRLEESLRMAALWDEVKDHLDRPGISLSGGQQQRLLHRPGACGSAGGSPDGRTVFCA